MQEEPIQLPEANPLLIKGESHVEDEEGELILLATRNYNTTPSILFTTNQVHGNRENTKFPDWCSSGF